MSSNRPSAADYYRQAAAAAPDLVETLRIMVDTDSGPGDDGGIGKVYDQLSGRLRRLGFDVRLEPNAGPDVFVARRSGDDGAPRIMLIGHADTVFPAGTPAERPFADHGDRFSGPGVADMKGGLVVMLGGLELLGDQLDAVDVTVLVNGDEESGSLHSRPVVERLARDQDVALVFEPGLPVGAVTKARNGAHRLNIEVTGRPAHTGVNPQDGANAIEEAAHHVLRLQELGRSVSGATVTAAMITGGSRPNIVPDHAVIRVDIRFNRPEAEAEVLAEIERITATPTVAGTSTVVHHLDQRPAFVDDGRSDWLVDLYLDGASEIGVDVEVAHDGGSSDGNFTSAQGVVTLDGLGMVGGGYHTDEEYVEAETLPQRVALFAALMSRLVER